MRDTLKTNYDSLVKLFFEKTCIAVCYIELDVEDLNTLKVDDDGGPSWI